MFCDGLFSREKNGHTTYFKMAPFQVVNKGFELNKQHLSFQSRSTGNRRMNSKDDPGRKRPLTKIGDSRGLLKA